jgi:2,3-bisphosphoglycerate-independent phosphoglycerate mutase
MDRSKKKVTLVILDGWGYSPAWGGNAITEAKTPNFDWIWRKYPHTTLKASGKDVGLPGHEMGNSEVGHLTIGTGRITPQDVSRINQAIEDGSFYKNKEILSAIEHVKKNKSKLQLVGLLSNGGIHSHINHLFALLKIIKDKKVNQTYLHLITDGRDSSPYSAHTFIEKLKNEIKKLGLSEKVKIATVSGRYYAMDRDNNWSRTQAAYQAMVSARGSKFDTADAAVSAAYRSGQSDQYLVPTVIRQDGVIEDNDGIIFFNFRADRARQLTSFFIKPDLKFKREKILKDIIFISMIPYQSYDLDLPVRPAFPTKEINLPLAEILANNDLKQFHVAETEKYAHVTYFFNGVVEDKFKGEQRVLVPSPKVDTYDLKPEMSAEKVCQQVLKAQKGNKYDFILVNFANPDMVGHTGNMNAVIEAVETVDQQLGKVIENRSRNETIMVTADHGNAEEMIDRRTGKEHTEHTNNPVPFILVNHQKGELQSGESLAGIANVILDELKLSIPKEMKEHNIYNRRSL